MPCLLVLGIVESGNLSLLFLLGAGGFAVVGCVWLVVSG